MAKDSSSRARKGEVLGIEFKPAKGGLVSETHMRYKRGGQGGGPDWDHESETGVHPNMEHAHAHLEAMMGHCFGAGEAKEPNAEVEKEETQEEE